MESSIEKECVSTEFSHHLLSFPSRCQDTRAKIAQLTVGDYAIAKADVDRLRQELGQPPLPSLQSTLDEKTNQ
jgi:hypothetical protein